MVESPGMGHRRAVAALVWLLAALLFVSHAAAQDSVAVLAKRLKAGDDFRVRTQAALALGATKSKAAVEPLCAGLSDSNTTVRAASAAALGRLKLGGKECLQKRLAKESAAPVKASISKAIKSLADADGPNVDASTTVYLAIAKTSNGTGRADADVDKLVRSAMTKAARELKGYVLAPAKETPAQAKTLLAQFPQVKAFYLTPKVQKPEYKGGNLTVRFEISIFTYPGRALKGSVPIKLTQADVSSEDAEAEEELIRMAAGRAVEKLSENVGRIE